VEIIGVETIEQHSITTIEDIAYLTPSAQPLVPSNGGVSIGYVIRGFADTPILMDGYNPGASGTRWQRPHTR